MERTEWGISVPFEAALIWEAGMLLNLATQGHNVWADTSDGHENPAESVLAHVSGVFWRSDSLQLHIQCASQSHTQLITVFNLSMTELTSFWHFGRELSFQWLRTLAVQDSLFCVSVIPQELWSHIITSKNSMKKNVGPACPLNGSWCLAFYQPLPLAVLHLPCISQVVLFQIETLCVHLCVCRCPWICTCGCGGQRINSSAMP